MSLRGSTYRSARGSCGAWEGRYAFGGTTTGSAFDFENLDLSGFQATIGLAVRF